MCVQVGRQTYHVGRRWPTGHRQGIIPNEVSKVTGLYVHEVVICAHLDDTSLWHHHDTVHVGKPLHRMRDQNTSLEVVLQLYSRYIGLYKIVDKF